MVKQNFNLQKLNINQQTRKLDPTKISRYYVNKMLMIFEFFKK